MEPSVGPFCTYHHARSNACQPAAVAPLTSAPLCVSMLLCCSCVGAAVLAHERLANGSSSDSFPRRVLQETSEFQHGKIVSGGVVPSGSPLLSEAIAVFRVFLGRVRRYGLLRVLPEQLAQLSRSWLS